MLAKIIEDAKTESIFGDVTYNLKRVAINLQRRGCVGEELYSNDHLKAILKPLKEDAKTFEYMGVEIDRLLQGLSKRIEVGINRLRQVYYSELEAEIPQDTVQEKESDEEEDEWSGWDKEEESEED